MSLPPFITIPRPTRRHGPKKSGSDAERYQAKMQIYFAPGEKELVQRAADLCGCTVSEYLRQLANHSVTALEVSNGTGTDQRR